MSIVFPEEAWAEAEAERLLGRTYGWGEGPVASALLTCNLSRVTVQRAGLVLVADLSHLVG